MAAATLTEATQSEIVSIFKAISNKVQGSVDGLVKTTQPKLNKLVADTIDAFRDKPQQVNKQMNLLANRMQELGMSVDDLTQGIEDKDLTADMKSLQDALRNREQKIVKADAEAAELRKQGVAAEVKMTEAGAKVVILSQKELSSKLETLQSEQKILVDREQKNLKATKDLEKLTGKEREAQQEIVKAETQKIAKDREKLEEKEKAIGGRPSEDFGGQGGDMIDPRGMFAGISDTFMGVKDSITGPFVELGDMAKRMGTSFMNFGKAMKTPIKSLKLFGASLMISVVPMLLWALGILALIAVIAIAIFKFHAIKDAIVDAYNYLGDVFRKFGEYLMEKWNAFVGYIGGLKDSLMEKWDNFTQGISDMVEYVSTLGSRIWDSIKEAFGSIGDYISDIFKRIYNGFVDKFGKYIGMEKVALSSDKATMTEPKSIEGEAQKAEVEESQSTAMMKTDKADQTGNAKALKEAGDTNSSNSSNNVGITQDNKQIITTNNAESQFVGSGNRNPDPPSVWERMTSLF